MRSSKRLVSSIPSKLKHLYPYLIGFAACVLLSAGSYLRVFDTYEYQTYDWRFRVKAQPPISDEIVLIEIWDDSLEKIGRWPFSRQYHAILIDVLRVYGAKMLGFDILLVEPGVGDEILRDAARTYGQVYFSHAFERESSVGKEIHSAAFQAPLLDDFKPVAKGIGHVNAKADPDGKRRRIPPIIYREGQAYPHLGILMAADYLGIPRSEIRKQRSGNIELGDHAVLPVDEKGYFFVNYSGRWTETFHHVSYVDILSSYAQVQKGGEPSIDLDWLKGKVCFLGLTATGTHDINPIPLEPAYPQMGLHANVFNSILNKRFIFRLSRAANLAIFILLGVVAAGFTRIPRLYQSLAAAVALVATYVALAVILFASHRVWIDLFYPLAAFGVIYLSGIVNRTVNEKHRRELLESELTIASEIQRSFLPSVIPESELLDIAAFMKPAKHVGGDLYSIFRVDQEHIGVMLGDVSGKGVPAALFMARSVSEFKFSSHGSKDPAQVLTRLNDSLSEDESSGLFVTVTYSVFDLRGKRLTLSSGGHLPVLCVRSDGASQWLSPEGGMPIALMPGVEFGNIGADLKAGDIFVFYSDGVSEAKNVRHADYETERLVRVVGMSREKRASEIREAILEDIHRFVGRAPQHDDLTMIVVKVR